MKSNRMAKLAVIPLALAIGGLGCGRKLGPPNDQEELMRPENVTSFDRLYKQNCSACHGVSGAGGPALDLANPQYQAIVDDASLRQSITNGMAGTEMPAFGETAGGLLTTEQVDVLVIGMRVRWKPKYQITTDTPPYSSNAIGRVEQGQEVFRTTCTFCHQQGLQKITDPTYLSLVSDQSLRTIVIAGRPDLGHPDWKHVRRNQPLTGQDVSDVIIYLHSLRSDTPGQPYPETSIKR